ncbi:hypothetical protein QZH41_017011, partial [Actinostola sp. cb2023]
ECISWKNHSREDHIEAFMSWYTQHGGVAKNVKIHKFGDEGYGLIATEDIQVEENFVTVPQKLMMTLESAKKSELELGPLIEKDHILSSMPHAAIALYVLCEKLKEDSWWKPYLDILPSSYSTSLYFTPDDLKAVQGTSTLGDAVKPYRSIARQYAYFYKLCQVNSSFSSYEPIYHKFVARWAVSTVMTRQNQVPISDSENIKALIPMWDMCNHTNGTIETGFDTKDATCKSYALRSFSKDEQVLIFYGKRNNADLLFHNGFVYPDNEHDFVNIPLGVSRSDKLYAMKAQIMAMVGIDASARPYAVLRGSNPISPELRVFLRIFSMDHDELKIRLFNPERKEVLPLSELPKPEVIVSDNNEIRMLHYLNMRLKLILTQYKTTLEEDEEHLQSTELTTNAKNCLLLRITERRILGNAFEYTGYKLQEAKKKLEETEKTDENVDNSTETTNGSGSLESKMEHVELVKQA